MNNLETVALRKRGAGSQIKEYTIDYPNKFKSIKDAERFANNIKRKILDLCKKNKWFCFVYIGVSELDRKAGMIVKVKTKNRGRPLKQYKRKHKNIDIRFVDPHIHIYMYGIPGGTLAEKIKKYLYKKSKCNIIDDIKVKKVNRDYQLRYIKEQCIKHRLAYRDTNDLLIISHYKRLTYLKDTLDINF